MSIPLDFIQTITVSALEYPLYDHFSNPTKCYFALGPVSIWDVTDLDGKGRPKSFPAALNLKSTFEVQLSPAGIAALPNLTPPYTLTAKLDAWDIFNSKEVVDITTGPKNLSLLQPTVNGQPKSLPWALYGDAIWTLKGSKSDQPQYTCETTIEVFVLPTNLPPFFDRSGIPLAFLRLSNYLPTWMQTPEQVPGKTAIDWPSFAVNAVFSDPRLEYETWSGARKYSSWSPTSSPRTPFTANEGIECWFDLWLSDLQGVTKKGLKHAVNCYGLAALCQAVVSLGVDSTVNSVRMKYMKPFGYINPTHLIGRVEIPPNPKNPDAQCNNPFYGNPDYNPPMLCDFDTAGRSAFDNHMFLTINKGTSPFVLDACCGPQLGTNKSRPGALGDIADGVGVTDTVNSRCFERVGAPDPNSPALIDKMALDMQKYWYQPYLSAPAGNWEVTATWTYLPFIDKQEIITANVFTYSSYYEVNEAYEKRIADIRGWVGTNNLQDGFSDMMTESIRIFCGPLRLYLAIVEAKRGKSDTAVQLKTKLQSILNNSLSQNPQPTSYIASVACQPQAVCRIGYIATVTIKVNV
ncbi:hypothetical protein BGZ61DRAFT_475579 [Ilyonectria robusta]|uniref:uncharacterized protein n=1 Tax=Ilyonectria robusta TaxID=1079257 RepID=UPI001E8E9A9F|nr:uncharacterized protein BGZ61DRAFT_475579 [Ilyonectria robusta]KAH8721616.1 hypothetical protein BGZ61DRAFT_475579 [Ilyonectria robusta]